MRPKGTAKQLEQRRLLAARRVVEDELKPTQVAEVLGVHVESVRLWARQYRTGGAEALAAKQTPGRPARLSEEQEQEVLSWFSRPASEFGFTGDWWTAPRVAKVIEETFGVSFHPRYLNAWLAQRRITPQKPANQPRERDEAAIEEWLEDRWPELVKKAGRRRSLSC